MSTSEVQGNTSTQNWQELGATDTVQKSASHKGFVSGDGITGITYSAGTQESNNYSEAQVNEFRKSLSYAIGNTSTIDLLDILGSFTQSTLGTNEVTKDDEELAKDVDGLLKKSTISDFDIRELMKLLIKAFSQLMNSQRQVTLNTITNIVTALKAKVKDMEKSRNENFNAALASAIGGIVSGALQAAGGAFSLVGSSKTQSQTSKVEGTQRSSLESSSTPSAQSQMSTTEPATGNAGAPTSNKPTSIDSEATASSVDMKKMSEQEVIEFDDGKMKAIGKIFESSGGIFNSIATIISADFQAKAKGADIDSAIQDALMEVLRKMQDEGSNEFKQLIQFISTLLQMLQELQRNASSTEQTIVRA